MDTPLLDRSVGALLAAMRAGTLSPVALLEAHLARITKVNPLLNAVVADRFTAARDEAEAAAARYRAAADPAALPPLLGVPCTIKEFLPVAGLPLTAGIAARRDRVATEDAVVVQRLRAAGAIVMGVTNVPEGGLWMETANALYGVTNNPWDVTRTSGGSSGGEAAIVAAGGAPFGIGSDVGGSIRIPAALCGVVGHKGTGGLVPNTGHWPGNPGIGGFLCTGPIGRTVDDLVRVLRVIAGPDEGDPCTLQAPPLQDPDSVDLRTVTVFPVPGDGRLRVANPVRKGIARAAQALEAQGARVGTLDPRRLRKGFRIWSSMLTLGGSDPYKVLLGDGQPIRPLLELLKMGVGRSQHTFMGAGTALLEPLSTLSQARLERFIDLGRRLRDELEALLGDRGVLLYPPYTGLAPRHHWAKLRPFDPMCTGLFNVLEFPGTVVPVGAHAGLPVAVQILGGRGHDHLTLAVGRALERALGGWRRANPKSPGGRWRPELGLRLHRTEALG
ncbi:MAG: amidase [Myxococcales bacterium]|nr:amidase [Myxococcales bacterium]MCB9525876.1 amidase [Myxococcales bacterium]